MAGKKRVVICDVRVGDQVVRVIGAHLSHRSESLRVRSVEVLARLAADSEWPVIVAGDLNSTPPGFPESARDAGGRNAVATLDASGRFRRMPVDPPPSAALLTFPSPEPTRLIDWILVPPDWDFLDYAVEPSPLSDHRPVRADVAPTDLNGNDNGNDNDNGNRR